MTDTSDQLTSRPATAADRHHAALLWAIGVYFLTIALSAALSPAVRAATLPLRVAVLLAAYMAADTVMQPPRAGAWRRSVTVGATWLVLGGGLAWGARWGIEAGVARGWNPLWAMGIEVLALVPLAVAVRSWRRRRARNAATRHVGAA